MSRGFSLIEFFLGLGHPIYSISADSTQKLPPAAAVVPALHLAAVTDGYYRYTGVSRLSI